MIVYYYLNAAAAPARAAAEITPDRHIRVNIEEKEKIEEKDETGKVRSEIFTLAEKDSDIKNQNEAFQYVTDYLKTGIFDFHRISPQSHNQLIEVARFFALSDLEEKLSTFTTQDIDRIGHLTNLHSLKIENLNDENIRRLAPQLKNIPNLLKLTLNGDLECFEDDGMSDLEPVLSRMKNLTSLIIDGYFGECTGHILAHALSNMPELKLFSINTIFADADFNIIISKLSNLKNFKALLIRGYFQDFGLQFLTTTLSKIKNLELLSIDGAYTDTFSQNLATALKSKLNLKSLKLNGKEYIS